APANSGIGPFDQPINVLNTLAAGVQQFRTPLASLGSIRFQWQKPNGTPQTVTVNWAAGQTLAGVLGAINAALGGAGAQFTVGFTAATQQFTITGNNPLPASAASPLSAIEITDLTGNLGMAFNLEAQPAFGTFKDALLAQIQAQVDDLTGRKEIADAAVAQLQVQQDAISKVDIEEEKARMLEFARAYEASVRAMVAMDEMLNTLINRMAVGTFAGSPTSSVLNS
ncbi:MAG TPA: flagellar basal body rod C-terminal domain-containing protein, partial [Candidatus Dormibacteraeota bacterium]|nr:flagellar basal body rod C-terminal domain-containing protein [Candidatus Dormibacteraeota bacterium]